MKITDIRVHPMGMPAERVRWTAQEITRRVELTLVEVRTDAGIVGIGEISTGPQVRRVQAARRHGARDPGAGPAAVDARVGQAVLDHGAAARRARRLGRPAAAARAATSGRSSWRRWPASTSRCGTSQAKAANLPVFRLMGGTRTDVLHLCGRRLLSTRAASRSDCADELAGYVAKRIPLGQAQVRRAFRSTEEVARASRRARGDRPRHPVHARHERALRRRHLHPLRARGRAVRHLLARGAAALVPAAARLCDAGEGDPHPAGARRARMAPVHGARLHRLRRDRASCSSIARATPGSARRCASRGMRRRRACSSRRTRPRTSRRTLPRHSAMPRSVRSPRATTGITRSTIASSTAARAPRRPRAFDRGAGLRPRGGLEGGEGAAAVSEAEEDCR